MDYEKEKEALVQKYASKREWFQSTPTYGCWIYPNEYYIELVEIVLESKNKNG